MSGPRKVFFVGLSTKGWASTTLGPAITNPSLRDKYSLVALATSSESSAKEAAEKWTSVAGNQVEGVHGEAGKERGLAPDIDLVAISVKAPLHKATIWPFIKAGKDFFLEWPAGKTSQETREIAEEAKKHGVRSLIGFQGRQAPALLKAKELIRNGKIGKVVSSTTYGLLPREFQIYTPEHSTSQLYLADPNNGATWHIVVLGHHFDNLTNMLGNFTCISATGTTQYPVTTIIDDATKKPTGETLPALGPDHIAISGVLESGTLVSSVYRVVNKGTTPGREIFRWEIEGEEGTIKLVNTQLIGALPVGVGYELYVNGEKVEFQEEFGVHSPVDAIRNNFNEFAKKEQGDYATIDDAVRIKGLLDAVQESLQTGERVNLGH